MIDPRKSKWIIKFIKAWRIFKTEGFDALYKKIAEKYLSNQKIGKLSHPGETLKYDTTTIQYFGKKLAVDNLVEQFLMKGSSEFIVVLSQDDYLTTIAGVQLRIADEQKTVNGNGIGFLHVFPYQARSTLDFSESNPVLGVNLDGDFLGFIDGDKLSEAFQQMLKKASLKEIRLHHLIGYQRNWVIDFLEIAGSTPKFFWIHDFFSICPNYPLLRNDKEFCHAPSPESNACQLCRYGAIRPKSYEFFVNLFQRYRPVVVAPSDFALKFWQEKFPVKGMEGIVKPNALLEATGQWFPQNQKQAIKIGFLGYPLHHKGWQTWLKLTEKFAGNEKYQFIHFSSIRQPSLNFRHVNVKANLDNRHAMVDALKKEDVDIALLWSICPETFSYTLYEALAAGCTILTNPTSGNIQAYLKKNAEAGIVIESEDKLMEAFDSDQIFSYRQAVLRNQRPEVRIVFGLR